MSGGQQQQVPIDQVPLDQLIQVKKQLDEEIDHLTGAFSTLKSAEHQFKGCMTSLNGLQSSKGKEMLLPLTASLYVQGSIIDTDTVKVDVGTGYYVEKTVKEAKTYYNTKLLDLRSNIDKLQETIEQKSENRQVVVATIQRKAAMQQQEQSNEESTA